MTSFTIQSHCKASTFIVPTTSYFSQTQTQQSNWLQTRQHSQSLDEKKKIRIRIRRRRREVKVYGGLFPVDPWAPNIDSQSIATQIFAVSLFPYIGFLYFITKSKSCPKLTLFGFYFLLTFVGATIPAGIYAKVHYGTSLSNVDWLHGGAEALLTLTNLFIVMGLREALRKEKDKKQEDSEAST